MVANAYERVIIPEPLDKYGYAPAGPRGWVVYERASAEPVLTCRDETEAARCADWLNADVRAQRIARSGVGR